MSRSVTPAYLFPEFRLFLLSIVLASKRPSDMKTQFGKLFPLNMSMFVLSHLGCWPKKPDSKSPSSDQIVRHILTTMGSWRGYTDTSSVSRLHVAASLLCISTVVATVQLERVKSQCIHTYIHTYMCIYIYIYKYTYIHTCMHACMHACIYIYTDYMYMHAYIRVCMRAGRQARRRKT